MADGVLKGVYPLFFGCPRQLFENKLIELSNLSIKENLLQRRKKGRKGKKENTSIRHRLSEKQKKTV